MKLKIVFIDGRTSLIYVAEDGVKDVIDAIEREEKWIKIDGFYMNSDNIAYIATIIEEDD